MASSSSPPPPPLPPRGWDYDVFLSFRGEDTRKNFVDHLNEALKRGGINTFKDDEKLGIGKSIYRELPKAIKKSRIAIIVFSKDYASSSWCLDELVEIIECKNTMGQMVFPVFYNVDPSDIQEHKGSFAEAFVKHEETFGEDKEKMQSWRKALADAADLSGYDLNNIADGHEAKFIKKIVREILKELGHVPLFVAKYQVGIEAHVNKMITLLNKGLEDVQIVGIYGTGGIGKTTIAKAVFNQIFDQFESRCFLSNVKEFLLQHGPTYLQQQLLNGLLMEDGPKICNVDYGISMIKQRLCHKKVLVVLDNVDSLLQLEVLVGANDWFGSGSKIIITTRDKRFLVENKVDHGIYRVELLNEDEALQLFSWHAFVKNYPEEDYLELARSAINYAQGLPLALQVLGSLLYKRNKLMWKEELDKLKRIPNKKIQNVLRLSFDGLDDMDQKNIFLDIACFFNGWKKEYVINLLKSCGFFPRIGIHVLIERSLLTITNDGILSMHNLIEEMGREIVREESPDNPGKRSRLWSIEDIYEVLRDNTGTEKIKGIMLKMPHDHPLEELHVNVDAFAKMKKLKLLELRGVRLCGQLTYLSNELRCLVLEGYPAAYLPSNFHPQNLVELQLSHGHIKQISTNFSKKLKLLNLRGCPYLEETPDLSSLPCLEEIYLQRCANLVKVHFSSGVHERLYRLSLSGCTKLRTLPRSIRFKNLAEFNLGGCLKLDKFPEIEGDMYSLRYLYMGNSGIKDLPSSFENLIGLQRLYLTGCKKLKSVPSNIFSRMKNLGTFDMEGTAMTQLPSSMVQLSSIKRLHLCPKMPRSFLERRTSNNSTYLQLELVSHLRTLISLSLRNCNLTEESFPNNISSLSSLRKLDLSATNLVSIPSSFIQLTNLSWLSLRHCISLRTLTSLPPSINDVDAHGCTSLERYWIPSTQSSPHPPSRLFFLLDPRLLIKSTFGERKNMSNISSESQLQENFIIIYSAIEIPHWFNFHLSRELSPSVCLRVNDHHCNNVKGIALCAICALEFDGYSLPRIHIDLKINGYPIITPRHDVYFHKNEERGIKSMVTQVIFVHKTEYYDEDEKGYRPIKNLRNKKPKLSAGPPNICDDACYSDDGFYIEASIHPINVEVKKWGIHLVTVKKQAEASEQVLFEDETQNDGSKDCELHSSSYTPVVAPLDVPTDAPNDVAMEPTVDGVLLPSSRKRLVSSPTSSLEEDAPDGKRCCTSWDGLGAEANKSVFVSPEESYQSDSSQSLGTIFRMLGTKLRMLVAGTPQPPAAP